MKKNILAILVFMSQVLVNAGGFQINEHGAKSMAMGGAFTALAYDPSAIYWNSAGILQMTGTHFMVGTTLITPYSSFRGVSPDITEYKLEKQVFFPSHFYATHRINKDLAVGLGFTSPFGLGTKWDENWIGRYLALETKVQVFTVTPVVSYAVMDNLFVSGGLVYSFADVFITKKTPQAPFTGDAYVELEGNDMAAFGYQFSVLYKPLENLSLGATFHSGITYDFEGTATSTGASQLAAKLPNGDITAELKTPINMSFGIGYKPMKDLQLSADFQYIAWSSYDTLAIDFKDPKYTDAASPRLYNDTYIIRFGADYKLMDELNVMAGIYFDNNPVDPEMMNPNLPEADRLGFSAGLEYKLTNNLGISLSYLYIRGKQLTISNSEEYYTSGNAGFNGTYNSGAHLGSISISYGL